MFLADFTFCLYDIVPECLRVNGISWLTFFFLYARFCVTGVEVPDNPSFVFCCELHSFMHDMMEALLADGVLNLVQGACILCHLSRSVAVRCSQERSGHFLLIILKKAQFEGFL